MELKSRKLTLVVPTRTKRAFHPAFWRKQMKEQFNTRLTMQTISLCCPLLQRKTRRLSSCPLCIPKKKRDEDTGKEEIDVFYNQEKGGVDSHDQMCSLYTTARKTHRWPMRLFYGIIDSAALNAFVIFTENVPKFVEHKKEKRQKFLKELALALIIPHATNTTRCETGHSQLRHFIGNLISSKHHPALFSTAQEMLHLSQIKGQENQIHL